LKQLVHLGLPGQLFVPAFLQELHQYINSVSNSFCWLDHLGQINNLFDELQRNRAVQKFCQLSDDTNNKDYHQAVLDWIQQLKACTTTQQYQTSNKALIKYYHRGLLSLGYDNSCCVPVFRQGSQNKSGLLLIHRAKTDPDFSKREKALLQQSATLIAHGLEHEDPISHPNTDGWAQGLLIINYKGEIQRTCSKGQELLTLAAAAPSSRSGLKPTLDIHVFTGIDELIHKLSTTPHTSSLSEDEFTLNTYNAWGEFKLTGFLIRDLTGRRTAEIGLNIMWQVPFVLKLFHKIKDLSLTPRQESVALLYAKGQPIKTMANQLGLSLYTVKEHVQNIFERLQIHSRAELIELIICDQHLSR
jgi:DNA-binding CsgD family transcriptional regulator